MLLTTSYISLTSVRSWVRLFMSQIFWGGFWLFLLTSWLSCSAEFSWGDKMPKIGLGVHEGVAYNSLISTKPILFSLSSTVSKKSVKTRLNHVWRVAFKRLLLMARMEGRRILRAKPFQLSTTCDEQKGRNCCAKVTKWASARTQQGWTCVLSCLQSEGGLLADCLLSKRFVCCPNTQKVCFPAGSKVGQA